MHPTNYGTTPAESNPASPWQCCCPAHAARIGGSRIGGSLSRDEAGHGGLGDDPVGDAERRHPLRAWRERRTLLIGVFVFTAAFTEGTGNDWLGVAMIDGYGAVPALGSLIFAIFLAAMTLGRWFGPMLLDRYGRVLSIRCLAVLALAGLALVVWGGTLPLAIVGAALWGVGIALGFPVGMSAAGDDPQHAAARMSVVASIGYLAFLAGPPLIGFPCTNVRGG